MRTSVLVASFAVALLVAGTAGRPFACDKDRGAQASAAQTAAVDQANPAADPNCGCGMGGGGKCCSAGAAGAAAEGGASAAPSSDGSKAAGCGCSKKKPAGS